MKANRTRRGHGNGEPSASPAQNVGGGGVSAGFEVSGTTVVTVRAKCTPGKDSLYVKNLVCIPASLGGEIDDPARPILMEVGLARSDYQRLATLVKREPQLFLQHFLLDFLHVGSNFMKQKKRARGRHAGLESALRARKETAGSLYDLFRFIIDEGRNPPFFKRLVTTIRKLGVVGVFQDDDPKEDPEPVALAFYCTERIMRTWGYAPDKLAVNTFAEQDKRADLASFYKHQVCGVKRRKFPKSLTDRDLEQLAHEPPYSGLFDYLFRQS